MAPPACSCPACLLARLLRPPLHQTLCPADGLRVHLQATPRSPLARIGEALGLGSGEQVRTGGGLCAAWLAATCGGFLAYLVPAAAGLKRLAASYGSVGACCSQIVLASASMCLERTPIIRASPPLIPFFSLPSWCGQEVDSPVKATDFGLSIRHRPEDPPLKSRSGTPAYMAPEVIQQSYDERADIWSAGIMMYQLLTGEAGGGGGLRWWG